MKKTCKIIAEIGWNHMGDMSLAKKMIDSASENGADFCKFQTWSVSKLKVGPWDNDGRREIYKKAELSHDQHSSLKLYCESKNISFLTSVFNKKDINFLSSLKLPMIKIPSHEIYNIDLIKECLDNFHKVLVSTGAAKWKEIEKILNLKKKENIILMHCISSYPLKAENVNFPRMEKLMKLSKETGYSGHFSGIEDAIIAISMGANYIEKHFTIDRNLPGRDNKFAILPEELKRICDFRDSFLQMNIDKGLDLQECEMDIYKNYRGRWG